MTTRQVLFAGGTGVVGRAAIRWFRERHPRVPVLVGGRNMQVAEDIARQVGGARAVAIDLDKPRLGLDDGVDVAAVVMMAPEKALHGLRYAQDLGVPYLSIVNWLVELGPGVALFAHRAKAAPVVLASHWSSGAALFLALNSAKSFETVRSVRIGVVLDEKDAAGPASYADMDRSNQATPDSLAFKGGRRVWLSGDSAKGQIQAIDGRVLDAEAYAPLDIISLHAATGASDVRFDLATAESSSRRRGGETAAEIIVELEGEAHGRLHRSRSTLEFKQGQASLTGLSAVLSLSAVLGLNNSAPATPGLYLPELLSDTPWFLEQLQRAGAAIHENAR